MSDAERYIDDERKTSNGCPVAKRVPRESANFRVPSRNVAAIDFGTTNCSVAYLTASDDATQGPQRLTLNNTHQRVPTAILFKEDGKVVSFGHEARNDYLALDDGDRVNYYYFEEIKMNLQLEEDVSREMTVKAANGKVFYLVDVIAHILKYLKSELLENLKRAGHPLKTTDFDWVVTVPAIWKARGKQMMREAGYKAGLCSTETCENLQFASSGTSDQPNEKSPDKLSLALEPESAAIYCHSDAQRLHAAYGSASSTSPGSYLVVDIGGGTVDISAYRIADQGGSPYLEIVQPPTGNDSGGTQVNKLFKSFLAKLVGDKDFSRYVATGNTEQDAKHFAQLTELVSQTFERQKTLYAEKSDRGRVSIRLPASFATLYMDALQTGVTADPDVQLVEHTLRLTRAKMEMFFEPVISEIHESVRESLKENDGQITTIYLVGGFGGSKYVHNALKQRLGETYSLIVPQHPQFSVVLGAALYGMNPDRVHARRADATYGISTAIPFDPSIHKEEYKILDEHNRLFCNKILETFVERGDYVCTGEVVTTTVVPFYPFQQSIRIKIYSSLEKDVWYITGEGRDGAKKQDVRLIGSLEVETPITLGGRDRDVEVTFDFSHTEIQVKGYNVNTREEVKTVVDFLSNQSGEAQPEELPAITCPIS